MQHRHPITTKRKRKKHQPIIMVHTKKHIHPPSLPSSSLSSSEEEEEEDDNVLDQQTMAHRVGAKGRMGTPIIYNPRRKPLFLYIIRVGLCIKEGKTGKRGQTIHFNNQGRIIYNLTPIIYNLVLIIYKKNHFIYNKDKKNRLYNIIGVGLCIKGGKPEKGGKIWHFFVFFRG
jgi:hypothetical protein